MTDLPALLAPGDALVFNDTRVIPAALKGVRTRGDAMAQVSVNLIERLDDSRWLALARPAKRLEPGDRIQFGDSRQCLCAREPRCHGGGEGAGRGGDARLRSQRRRRCTTPSRPWAPCRYRLTSPRGAPADDRDRSDYQTTFAREEGAVAAPTAGLHFTDVLDAGARGAAASPVTS